MMSVSASSLPRSFRKITLTAAREPGHPEGDQTDRVIIVAPLTVDGLIDGDVWSANTSLCRVTREHDGERSIGHLIRGEGGVWRTEYDVEGQPVDEVWFRLGSEKLVPGEYVSLTRDGEEHTLRVLVVSEF